MSTNFHTPHSTGAPLTAAQIDGPLGTLDAAITRSESRGLDVRAFGAIGNNIADDTTAISTAISTAAGGTVLIPEGLNFKITGALHLSSAGTRVRGGGTITQATPLTTIFVITADRCVVDGPTLVQTGTGTNPVTDTTLYGAGVGVSNCSDVVVQNCSISGAGNPAATGAGVYLSGATRARVLNNRITGGAMGVNIDSYLGLSGGNLVQGNDIYATDKGIVVDLAGGYTATNVPDQVIGNMVSGTAKQGITFGACANGFVCTGNKVIGSGSDGIATLSGSQGGSIVGNLCKSNTQSGICLFSGANFIVSGNVLIFNSLWGVNLGNGSGSNITGNQILANASGGIRGVGGYPLREIISGNMILSNGCHGIEIDNPYDTIIEGNLILANSQNAANTYSGIKVEGSSLTPTDLLIKDNIFKSTDGNLLSHQKYSVEYAAATGSNVRIEGNTLEGADTAPVSTAWAGIFWRDNTGYATEARGATSVADGGTISHGLSATPSRVNVTPSTAGEFASVTARSGSTFTVALRKHDGTGGTTQTVYWIAEA